MATMSSVPPTATLKPTMNLLLLLFPAATPPAAMPEPVPMLARDWMAFVAIYIELGERIDEGRHFTYRSVMLR